MADNIIIAKLDLDTNALRNSMAELTIKNIQLKKQMQEIAQATGGLSTATKEQAREYLSLGEAIKKNNATIKEGNTALAEAEQRLTKQDEILKKEVVTISEAIKNNKELRAVRNTLNTKTDGDKIKALNDKINENTNLIKNNSSELEKNKMNVGNYTAGILGAIDKTGMFSGVITKLSKVKSILSLQLARNKQQMAITKEAMDNTRISTMGFAASQGFLATVIGVSSGALKLFKLALISTGLGAIIVLLGSLIAYFSSTQEGINKVNKVLTPLKAVFSVLLGVMQELGAAMVAAFENPKEAVINLWEIIKTNLINRVAGLVGMFKSLGTIISSGFKDGFKEFNQFLVQTATGVENLVDKVVNKFSQAYKQGEGIAALQQKLSAGEAAYIKLVGQANLIYREQNMIADDATKSLEERIEASKRATKAVETEIKASENRLALEINIMKKQQALNATTDAEKAELARKEVEYMNARTDNLKKLTTQQNKANSLEKEAAAAKIELLKKEAEVKNEAQQKEQAEKIALIKEQQATEIANYNAQIKLAEGSASQQLAIKAEMYAKQLDFLQKNTDEEIRINDEKLKNGEISQTIHEANLLKIKRETQQAVGEIAQKSTDDALAFAKKETDDNIAEKVRLLELKRETMAAAGATAAEIKLATIETERAIDEEQIRASAEFRIATAEQQEAIITNITLNAARQRAAIEQEVSLAKLHMAGQVAGGIANLVDKETVLGKAAAVAQATINVAEGVTKAIGQGGLLGLATGVIVGAVGAISIAKILNTDTSKVSSAAGAVRAGVKKAERGGVFKLSGNRHQQGGIGLSGVEAEGGELMTILNRKQTELFLDHRKQPQIIIHQQKIDVDELKEGIREAVYLGSSEGTQAGSYEGISTSSQEGKISTGVVSTA